MTEPLRALLVSYAFPPVGGAGVQRVATLAKYLPPTGVRPTVLTVSNPSVPVRDESLLADLPPEAQLVRVRTLEPAYAAKRAASSASTSVAEGLRRGAVKRAAALAKRLLVPDPQLLWLPAAHVALAERLARRCDDVVLVSAPPFSQFLLGPLVRLARRVGLVLDYRDEWSTYRTSYENGSGARFGEWLEPRLLRRAHAITTATDEFRDSLLARFPFVDPARVHTVPNGYDPADFPIDLPPPPPD